MQPQPIQQRISLPPELQRAQEAIQLPEVQELMRKLADYNLAVCMPHMHNDDDGGFKVLPADMVQVERDLQVSFEPRRDAESLRAIPVAWQWQQTGPVGMAVCVQICTLVTVQSGGEYHQQVHNRS